METATTHRLTPISASRQRRAAGYLLALTAGTIWGTTGPLSTALYAEGAAVTDVGFWRILLASLGFLLYGVARPEIFRLDRRALWLVMGIGGALVAGFEMAYQFAIEGAGVASAVALLYVAPVIVAFAAWLLLGERLTPVRLLLAVLVMAGAAMTVMGAWGAEMEVSSLGVAGGMVAALCWSGSILVARFAVPIYGVIRVLFLTLAGGTLILAIVLPLAGHAPVAPGTGAAWLFILGLGGGTVLANFAFFGGVKRIDAAPASVATTIEPVVASLLGLLLFAQGLTAVGWIGLALVVTGVAGGYLREAEDAPAA
ncbi:MAG: DMT family transporter [Gemmatimonadetes bacterium]|nr:DMT family transporter [Gemmatimonadota bacterium]